MRVVLTGLICLWLSIGIAYSQGDTTTVHPDTTVIDLSDGGLSGYVDTAGKLRTEPTINSEEISDLRRHNKLEILAFKTNTNFIKVQYRELVGWTNYKILGDLHQKDLIGLLITKGIDIEPISRRASQRTRPDRPLYPHGEPDDTQEYKSGTYHSITYVYHCHDRRYKSYEYVKKNGRWVLDSEYSSDGICY